MMSFGSRAKTYFVSVKNHESDRFSPCEHWQEDNCDALSRYDHGRPDKISVRNLLHQNRTNEEPNLRRMRLRARTLRTLSYGTLTFFVLVFLFYVHIVQHRYSLTLPPPEYLYEFFHEDIIDANQTCRYPHLDPYDPSIRAYLADAAPIQCRTRQYTLTYVDDNGWLRVNSTALQESGYRWKFLKCQYRDLIRPPGDDDTVTYSEPRPLHIHGALLSAEFVSVGCTNFAGFTIYSNLHAHIIHKNSTAGPTPDADGRSTFNVQIIVFDSMSRSNFIRQLPKTYMYLVRDMGATVLRGMTKVGDNTLPNMAAVLVGKQIYYYPELPPVLQDSIPKPKYYDEWPLLWNNFSHLGYATMFGEDQPHLGLFNYLDRGFRQAPTDHYLRPFWMTLEASTLHRMSSNLCFGGIPKHMLLLDYLRRFLSTYTATAHFGLMIFSEINHDVMNQVGAMDDDMVDFLNSSREAGHLDDTVLIVMGDHGHRMSSITQTPIGSLESRLPFFAVHLPDTFVSRFPEAAANLKVNAGRLTSMFDLHYTLRDLFLLAQGSSQSPGVEVHPTGGTTLFGPILVNRTCAEAGVPNHYCACDHEASIRLDHPAAEKASVHLVMAINKVLEERLDVCDFLTLYTVHSAIFVTSNGSTGGESATQVLDTRWQQGQKVRLRVTVEVAPGGGMFQGVVALSETGPVEVMNGIDRVNKYGSQSACVARTHKALVMYCHCS